MRNVQETVAVAGEEGTEPAAQQTEEAGGEAGEHAQSWFRLGKDVLAALRALGVGRPRAQPALPQLDVERNGVHHCQTPALSPERQ